MVAPDPLIPSNYPSIPSGAMRLPRPPSPLCQPKRNELRGEVVNGP
jgi:hypothetical protein